MEWLTRKEYQLNGSYLLTTLGDRMWTFVIGLFMHQLGGMTWVAVQQLVDSLLKLICVPIAGQFLDRVNRNKIIQYSLGVNNVAVTISALIFSVMFKDPSVNLTNFLLVAAAAASVSRVASEIQRICFTKDWVVVISESGNVELSKVNSYMLVIDQASSALLPTMVGALLLFFKWEYVCWMIAAYNLISWALESKILRQLYEETELLQTRRNENMEEYNGLKDVRLNSISTYFKQTSWTAGFGLSLLYMTVLGFDNLATSYGQKHGLSATFIGVLRSLGAILGILGAISYPRVANRVGLLWTVMIGLIWQNFFIEMCGVSVLLPGSSMDVRGFFANTTMDQWRTEVYHKVAHPESHQDPVVSFTDAPFPIYLFFMGIMFARYGLWLADPAITQIQQETIPEKQRYMVFTVQTGLNELFAILKDIIVILLPFTSLFGLLTLGSCAFVFTGFMFNVFYHAQCGFSLTDKNKHLPPKQDSSEMSELSSTAPERQSLIGERIEKTENE